MKTYLKKEKGPFPACWCSFVQLLRVGTLQALDLFWELTCWPRGHPVGEGCQEHLGEGLSARFLPTAAPLLALQSPPGSVPGSCRQQATAEGSQNQDATSTATGRDEGDKPPQPALMGSVPSFMNLVNLQLPKPILQRKSSPKPCSLLILAIRSPAKPIDFYFAVNQA